MTLPAIRRRWPERWRASWPSEFWDPAGEFTQLWDRMGRIFETGTGAGQDHWVPAVETDEADDAYLVRAELPGMQGDDVNVELSGHELRITGEVNEEDANAKTLRQRHGKFAYHMSLPADADLDKADAQMGDGVLTVRLPKAAQARSRKIAIKH
jgi:HSP20 family protein